MNEIRKISNDYVLFTAVFNTTNNKNFTTDEIVAENQVIETSQLNYTFAPEYKSQVCLCGLKCINSNKYFLSYEKIDEMFDNLIFETFKQNKKKCVCYFHNLKFHGSYIVRWLIKNNWHQTLLTNKYNQEVIKYHEFTLLASNGKWFRIALIWKGIKIVFLDSLKLYPQTLKKIAKDLLSKSINELTNINLNLQHNYSNDVLNNLKTNTETLYQLIKNHYQNEKFRVSKFTLGSLAYLKIKKIIQEKIPDFTIKDFNIFTKWVNGGLNFPSLKFWGKWVYKKNKIKMIDANSMYPSIMSGFLPFGKPEKKPLQKWKNYTCFYEIKIIKASIKDKFNDIGVIWKPFEIFVDKNLQIKKLNHLTSILPNYHFLQEVENEIYYVCEKELEIWKKLYDIKYKIIDTFYFETDNYLKDIINNLSKEKTKSSIENNESKYLFNKLILNNLFGKIGQSPIRSMTFYGDKKDIDLNKFSIKCEKNGMYAGFEVIPVKKEADKAYPVFLSAFITSSARVELLNQYIKLKEQGAIFLYCDTDSLIYCDTKKGVSFDNIHQYDLHKWKFKITNADAFCALCSKQYRIIKDNKIIKSASAGIDNSIMDKIPNDDYNYDCGDKYQLFATKLIDSDLGKTIIQSPFNFNNWKKLKKNPILPKELKKLKKVEKN